MAKAPVYVYRKLYWNIWTCAPSRHPCIQQIVAGCLLVYDIDSTKTKEGTKTLGLEEKTRFSWTFVKSRWMLFLRVEEISSTLFCAWKQLSQNVVDWPGVLLNKLFTPVFCLATLPTNLFHLQKSSSSLPHFQKTISKKGQLS